MAVDRRRFLAIGGYDPIYFPGRIEDLDLGFRGWMAGYRGYYVPESVAYHRGFGTFGPELGEAVCDELASRNSLIFMWKNIGGRTVLEPFFLAADALGPRDPATGVFAFCFGASRGHTGTGPQDMGGPAERISGGAREVDPETRGVLSAVSLVVKPAYEAAVHERIP